MIRRGMPTLLDLPFVVTRRGQILYSVFSFFFEYFFLSHSAHIVPLYFPITNSNLSITPFILLTHPP